jgi:hypothetical protein
MAKKDKKDSKKKDATARPDPADVVEAVRGAVERTLQATTGQTEGARERGRGLLEDVASAAQRIRESFDDLKVLEDVRGLRAEIDALSRRVAELERQAAEPAGRRSGGTARKAPAKPTAAGTAAATTGPKPSPAATRRKPPAGGTG